MKYGKTIYHGLFGRIGYIYSPEIFPVPPEVDKLVPEALVYQLPVPQGNHIPSSKPLSKHVTFVYCLVNGFTNDKTKKEGVFANGSELPHVQLTPVGISAISLL